MSCKMVAHASNHELFTNTTFGIITSVSSSTWSVLVSRTDRVVVRLLNNTNPDDTVFGGSNDNCNASPFHLCLQFVSSHDNIWFASVSWTSTVTTVFD